MTSIFYLPNEILIIIMSKLDTVSFQHLLQTCNFLSEFGNEEMVWKEIAKRDACDIIKYIPIGMTYKWLCLARNSPGLNKQLNVIYGNFNKQGENGICISIQKDKVLSGHFTDGKLNGVGTCYWSNGNRYEGDWVNDKQEGNGKFFWGDDYYEGEWIKDHRHGQGKYIWSKGSYYVGNFNMNILEGKGVYTWKHGYYEGDWSNSTRNGTGKIVWNNGNSFEGSFVRNSKCGLGIYRWSDGAAYEGNWDDDYRSGTAYTRWANGVEYKGEYSHDLRNGPGKLYWPNGDYYVGTWKNGGRYGIGNFFSVKTEHKSEKQFWEEPVKQFWEEPEKIQYSNEMPLKYP